MAITLLPLSELIYSASASKLLWSLFNIATRADENSDSKRNLLFRGSAMAQAQSYAQEIDALRKRILRLLREMGPCENFVMTSDSDACKKCTFLDYEHVRKHNA